MKKDKNILWFKELSIKDIPLVGGKNASLGEMYCQLKRKGVPVPNGFTITADAYNYFLKKAGLKKKILEILKGTTKKNIPARAKQIRHLILSAQLPKDLTEEIIEAYKKLSAEFKLARADVAVRSSATAEDLPNASFAGQQESFLNIIGEKALLDAVKKCFASLFTDRAVSYRIDQGFKHEKVSLSVGVQKMVRSDVGASGVMFTIDTESGNNNVILINAAYGLGEYVVKGVVNPDEYYVFKHTLNKGFEPIIGKQVGDKNKKLIYSDNPFKPTQGVKVPLLQQKKYVLTGQQILQLAKWAMIIEKHYARPMDIEWALDGRTDELFIVQARPETIASQKNPNFLEEYKLTQKGKVILTGSSVGMKIGAGKARVIKKAAQLAEFKAGEVLVTEMTDPDWEPIMKKAAGIITDAGGRTCFSGDTIVLTNKGFKKIEEIGELLKYEKIFTPSLNPETLKTEWKEIYDFQIKQNKLISVSFSQTGRAKNNILKTTTDHKFPIFENRLLISKTIENIVKQQEPVLVARRVVGFKYKPIKEQLTYLWGAIFTDGSIFLNKNHGEVQFIQKNIPSKKALIEAIQRAFKDLFGKEVKLHSKKNNQGVIRDKKVIGEASTLRCYSKEVAKKFVVWKENLDSNLLNCSKEANLSFLAGVIDGDGSYYNNRIQIYCSNEKLLSGIIISCLKNGFLPQVTNNRDIYNIQITEKVEEIFSYTNRVKGDFKRGRQGTVFFSARQLLADIIEKVNYKGRIKPYFDNNLFLDGEKIKSLLIPMIKGQMPNHELTKIVNSDTKMIRAKKIDNLKEELVYNLSIKDNHNYLVFTKQFTPVVVNNCHAAIVSRELGVPCIVGAAGATKKIKTGQPITVNCSEGEIGKIHVGILKFQIKKTNIKKLKRPKTKIMMNVGNPYAALGFSFIPNDGVGLAREEFIIANYIKIHPLALLNFNRLKNKEVKAEISDLTVNHPKKADFFVDKLAEGVGMIAAAFYPKDVIIRLSDFKSNEYANLIGGAQFEPLEPNPMIGWRGASRYYSPQYEKAFALECQALKKAREQFGLKNIKIMIPFCRTLEEGRKVIGLLKKYGLEKGKDGLEVYVMCEIPSNVLLADKFCEIFDGFSIGSNDLTQLTLGVDRDSQLVSQVYDENNEAVKLLISLVIEVAKAKKRKIGICGQAPSDFPDFAKFLVGEGIDSISLNPDTVLKTTLAILSKEKKRRKK